MPKRIKDTPEEIKRKKKEVNRKYYLENKARLNAEHLERYHTKYKHDPEYKEKQSIINKDYYNNNKEELLLLKALRKKRNKQAKIANEENLSITKSRVAKNPRQKTIKTDTPRDTINTNNLPKIPKVLPASDIAELFESVHSADITSFAKCNPMSKQMEIDAPLPWQENKNPVYNNPFLSSQLIFGSKPQTPPLVEDCPAIEDNDTFTDFIQSQLELP